MNPNFNKGSARIYQFPVGGRSGLAGHRQEEVETSADLAASRVSQASVGSAWYHDAAIQESKPARDR